MQGRNRIEQTSFGKFRAYYSFESRFCTPGSGHEKGGVEGLVGFSRRNFMVPVPTAASLEELNEKVLRQCLAYGNHKIDGSEQTVDERYEEEKRLLLSLPEAVFSNVQSYDGRIDKYATAIIEPLFRAQSICGIPGKNPALCGPCGDLSRNQETGHAREVVREQQMAPQSGSLPGTYPAASHGLQQCPAYPAMA